MRQASSKKSHIKKGLIALIKVNQITPREIYKNKGNLDNYYFENISKLVDQTTWVKEWEHIARRFRLFKFKDLSKEEIYSYQWDTEKVNKVIYDTVNEVRKHFVFDDIVVTVFPALPFPWFEKYDQSIWTNGFTNGPNNIQIAGSTCT